MMIIKKLYYNTYPHLFSFGGSLCRPSTQFNGGHRCVLNPSGPGLEIAGPKVIVAEPGRRSGRPVGRSPAEQDPLASQRRIGGKGVQTFALTATLDNAAAGHLGKSCVSEIDIC
jgi:hypothetical protein